MVLKILPDGWNLILTGLEDFLKLFLGYLEKVRHRVHAIGVQEICGILREPHVLAPGSQERIQFHLFAQGLFGNENIPGHVG